MRSVGVLTLLAAATVACSQQETPVGPTAAAEAALDEASLRGDKEARAREELR